MAEKEPIGAGVETDKKKPTFFIQVGQKRMKNPKKRKNGAAGFMDSCAQKIKAMVVRMAVTMRKFSVRMALSTRTENQG